MLSHVDCLFRSEAFMNRVKSEPDGSKPWRKVCMFEITVLSHFAGAHHLRHLRGRCEALHGHNWKVEATVVSNRLNREGIVLDFGILKQRLENILKTLDHTYLNNLPYFAKREPSSENIARYLYDHLKKELARLPVTLKSVSAWESETSKATYLGR
jgi:6-pyruvoyltetrahydropterin/6-carboxytetrahydropterin synthase